MHQILVIANQTFKEAVRNKILFVFVTLGVITICCSVFMPVVGDGSEKIKIVESMCFRSITFFGTLAAILLSASSIPTDIENKVLCTVTTKPVRRISIIFGKIVGFVYVIGVLLLIMGSVSYTLIRHTALKQGSQGSRGLLAREAFDPVGLQITGDSVRKIGNVSWIEGGGKGASVWEFKGLSSKDRNDDLEIEANFLVEGEKRSTGKIPVKIKIINPCSARVLTESMEVSRNKPLLLRLNGKSLDGSEELTIVVSPKNPGDFLGIRADSLRVFRGDRSFEFNYLKGLVIISTQFLLMVIIAVLGSTFLSLPVNILFCLFVFFCGNITDFMHDLSTVINVFETRQHEHGISEVMQKSNVFLIYLNHIIKKPILLLSYMLPDFKYFSVGKYFIDGINIPCKKIFMGFGYAVLYTLVCLPISFIVFKRKEIA
ncbi:MAG: ABC transporter permease [Planctomycetota bacterium]|jgi:ABC-type transport system involved in multi-copper enzyme maturation permease subunit